MEVYGEIQQTEIFGRIGQEIGIDRGRITKVLLYMQKKQTKVQISSYSVPFFSLQSVYSPSTSYIKTLKPLAIVCG